MNALVSRLPVFARKAIVDFVSVLVVGVLALTIAAPSGDWRDWLIAIAAAVGNVALNAFRRAVANNLPDALAWLAKILATSPAQ